MDNGIAEEAPVSIFVMGDNVWREEVDTDFTCVLTDVHPNGKAYNPTSGIVRARYRNSMTAELVEPGRVYEYGIDAGCISNVFKAGHRIRIQVSSSLYPEHDRNLNTGEPLGSGKTMHKAKQTVYHDAEYPSKLILPVIPRA
jgi:putative CocE/NonD family hydrolase